MSSKVSEQELFESIPWCKNILDDPAFAVEECPSRIPKPETREDALLAQTLKSSDTIEGWVSLYRRHGANLKDEVRTLLSLRPGLNGYPGVCHGGIVATMLDEVMSILVSQCRLSQGLPGHNVTADLHITYVKPVPTPAVILCKAKVKDIKGRKYYVDAEIVNENGVVWAKADGLFVSIQKEKL